MQSFITKSSTLWLLFGLFVLESIGFGLIMLHWDFVIIDEISHPETVRQHIAEMTPLQRNVHAWMTATLDVAYPFTYSALFAGLTLRVFSPGFAGPAFACIPVDLFEGVVQVLALTGTSDVVWLKAYVTPLKLFLFLMAIVIAVYALIRWIRRPQVGNDAGS